MSLNNPNVFTMIASKRLDCRVAASRDGEKFLLTLWLRISLSGIRFAYLTDTLTLKKAKSHITCVKLLYTKYRMSWKFRDTCSVCYRCGDQMTVNNKAPCFFLFFFLAAVTSTRPLTTCSNGLSVIQEYWIHLSLCTIICKTNRSSE